MILKIIYNLRDRALRGSRFLQDMVLDKKRAAEKGMSLEEVDQLHRSIKIDKASFDQDMTMEEAAKGLKTTSNHMREDFLLRAVCPTILRSL